MKAVVVYGTGDVRYEDYPEPNVVPGTVKIRVMACGICGSDIPRVWSNGAHSYPIILGHEFSGYISEIGEGVEGFQIGDRVAGVPLIPCMLCEDCKKGYFSQCRHYSFIGSRQQGAFADYVVVPWQNAYKIDQDIPYTTAAFFEPATVALHGMMLSHFEKGKNVLILGGGTIGLFVLQWANILGAKQVIVLGRNKKRLLVAKQLGANAAISILDEAYKEDLEMLSEGKGFHYVFETAGSTDMMRLAFDMAGNKAKLCFVGTPTENLTYSVQQWENLNRKELTLIGSWMSCSAPFPGKEWNMAHDAFLKGNLIINQEMLYQSMPMHEALEAFNRVKQHDMKGKIILFNEDL